MSRAEAMARMVAHIRRRRGRARAAIPARLLEARAKEREGRGRRP